MTSSSADAKLDAALDGLNNWYEAALSSGMGFQSDSDREAYVKSLGDPEKHPMFALNTEDMEGHPMVDAIRAIREEDKSNIELAIMYKEEGNEWMKKKDKKSLHEAYDRYSHALKFVLEAKAATTTTATQQCAGTTTTTGTAPAQSAGTTTTASQPDDTTTTAGTVSTQQSVGTTISPTHTAVTTSQSVSTTTTAADNSTPIATESTAGVKKEEEQQEEVNLNQLHSQLHSNRAAVSLLLQNYGSCKKDCQEAIDLWPENMKAHYRKCKALYQLKDWENTLLACSMALTTFDCNNQEILLIQTKANEEKKIQLNKQIQLYDKKFNELKSLWMKTWQLAVKQVGVSLGYTDFNNPEPLQLRDVWPQKEISSDGNSIITWPVLLLYPQYNQFDVIPDSHIDSMLAEQLAMVFPEESPAPWDIKHEYELSQLVVYLQLNQTTERITKLEDWLLSCLENYIRLQSGSFDLARYGLKQLNNYQPSHSKYGPIDTLTLEKFNEIIDNQSKARVASRQEEVNNKKKKGNVQVMEVHLGCSLRRILTAVVDENILPRGVLSLVIFPRDSSAHKNFLKALKADNQPIGILNPV